MIINDLSGKAVVRVKTKPLHIINVCYRDTIKKIRCIFSAKTDVRFDEKIDAKISQSL